MDIESNSNLNHTARRSHGSHASRQFCGKSNCSASPKLTLSSRRGRRPQPPPGEGGARMGARKTAKSGVRPVRLYTHLVTRNTRDTLGDCTDHHHRTQYLNISPLRSPFRKPELPVGLASAAATSTAAPCPGARARAKETRRSAAHSRCRRRSGEDVGSAVIAPASASAPA